MEIDSSISSIDLQAELPLQGESGDTYQQWTSLALSPMQIFPLPSGRETLIGPGLELLAGSHLHLDGLPLTRTGRRMANWFGESSRSAWSWGAWIQVTAENVDCELPWMNSNSSISLRNSSPNAWTHLQMEFAPAKGIVLKWGAEQLGQWGPEELDFSRENCFLKVIAGTMCLAGVRIWHPFPGQERIDLLLDAEEKRLNPRALPEAEIPVETAPLNEMPGPAFPGVPSGTIVMWTRTTPPEGWLLCDGSQGTPDLRNRFIVGAGKAYEVGTKGGQARVALTQQEMPNHHHNLQSFEKMCVMNQQNDREAGARKVGMISPERANIPTQRVGGGKPHENRPPFYALSFIMKQ